MNVLPKYIETYLAKRANQKYRIYKEPSEVYKAIIVIPVIQEYDNLENLIISLAECEVEYKKETLVLFCVNNSSAADEEVKEDNLKTILFLKGLIDNNDYGLNINFVDASTAGNELPEKDAGVGLARRTGVDTALNYFDYGSRKNIIVYLDGDCKVDPNYLKSIITAYDKENYKAAVIDFRHPLDNEAIVAYEIFLRYFILGLQYADSPYAYHSVGSTITLTPEIYVKVGGMNKKKAGEDFYFLEKISKVTCIGKIKDTVVYPAARKSWRVPFGTGKSITRFYEDGKDEYLLYSPEIFIVLKKWNRLLHSSNDIELILDKAEEINTSLYSFLIEQKFSEVMEKIISNSSSPIQIDKQKNIWFDAFKTLKLVHYLRDEEFGNEFMFGALGKMFKLCEIDTYPKWDSSSIPPIDAQIEYLEVLRKVI